MSFKINIFFIILLSVGASSAFAESLITVQTSDKYYNQGESIVIFGSITTMISNTPVTMQVYAADKTLIDVAQVPVAQDGTFTHTLIADGARWSNTGTYLIRVVYGEGNEANNEFHYTTSAAVMTTSNNFVVQAGDSGTFDVMYTIKGGTVKNIEIVPEELSLKIQIEATDDGSVTLELPRQYLGAEDNNKKDIKYIILVDGDYTEYEEEAVFGELRVIAIDFEQNDTEIVIIGTYIIPEFGMIAVMILVTGIIMITLVSTNKSSIFSR